MRADDVTSDPRVDRALDPVRGAPVAIEAVGLKKSFRIPTHRIDSFKERIVRPLASRKYRELHALDGVSFEIRRGEFFGIVGRNGSGKSTLLKLLASIYRADAGTIRMAGRLAPFIELGVGFNPELTARENVVLNGVMMGLTPQETRSRLGAVLEFAELEEFIDLKLKNYSSGMLVRLAFSLLMEVDADILLIDEVLAVGDAAFQQKCGDAFREMKAEGKTIVLVTHQMSAVEEYCHRAMLIDDGKIREIGDPAEVGRQYLRLNFEGDSGGSASSEGNDHMRVIDARVAGAGGERVESVEQGDEIRLDLDLELKRDISELGVNFMIANADGVGVFGLDTPVKAADGSTDLRAGDRVRIGARVENRLAPGRYIVHCGVNRTPTRTVLLYMHDCVEFVVFGGDRASGIVSLEHEIDATVEPEGDR